MHEITPEELLAQLVRAVDLFVASPAEQEGTGASVPGRGIALQFYDAVDVFSTRLREHRLLDTVDDAALQALNEYVLSVQTTLFQDGPFVMDAPEWERVRSLAATAAASLRRPPEQKLA